MRVALLAPDLDPGYGWARYALDLAQALSAQGVTVRALVQVTAAPQEEIGLDVCPVLPHLVPPTRGFLRRSLLTIPAVRHALDGCDLVHVVAEPYAPLAALAAGRRPLIVTAHGTYVPQTVRRRLVGLLYRWAYRRAHLIAVSGYTAEQVRAVLQGADPAVIHNGVHVARFERAAPAPEKRGPTILSSGGVKARKGTHVLIDALALIRALVPDAQLVITGRQDDSAYRAWIEAQIARLGLASAVQMPGVVPEDTLIGWYQHADVFALPSLNVGDRFEGFGLVVLEAGACGLPVVGTRGSGVEEAVIEGETGLLVPQDDAPALAAAITRLLDDPALRARMGEAGRQHARAQDWSAVAARVRAVYESALAAHAAGNSRRDIG
ncbi:MAG: glycosyltransferase family 4 protein [Chloroflexi bacterium]|nr:glycosyltransferase family 4 protein [Chloroflexota bacterium]